MRGDAPRGTLALPTFESEVNAVSTPRAERGVGREILWLSSPIVRFDTSRTSKARLYPNTGQDEGGK